jgi:hypothetical protein
LFGNRMATSTAIDTEVAEAGVTIGAGCATGGPVGCGVAAAVVLVKLGITELTQHTARLGNAIAENTAMDECIPAFDADIQLCSSAYKNGQASKATVNSAFLIIYNNCYAYLSSLVGKPGTAWNGTLALAQQGKVACDNDCTASCCIFWNDIYCSFYGCPQYSPGGGLFAALNGTSKDGNTPGVNTVGSATLNHSTGPVSGYSAYIPEIYPPPAKYGSFTRAAYVLDFTPPKPTASAKSAIQDSVAQLTANTTKLAASNATSEATATKLDSQVVIPPSGVASSGILGLTSSSVALVVGIVVLFVAVLLAMDA